MTSLQKRSSMIYSQRRNANFNVKIMEVAFISNLTQDLAFVSFMERKEKINISIMIRCRLALSNVRSVSFSIVKHGKDVYYNEIV